MVANPNRTTVLLAMKSVFETAVGASGTRFGKVIFEPYEGDKFRGQNVLSILEGPETYIDFVSPNKRDRELQIEFDVHAYVPMGTDLFVGANNVLADLEQIVEANERWDGEAIYTSFNSNLKEVEDRQDRTVRVVLFCTVRYRTRRNDPRI